MAGSHQNLERGTGCVPGNYETETGLTFTQYCDTNLPNSDLAQVVTDGFDACMELCSTYGALCYGAAFNEEKQLCWMKNATLTDYYAENGTDSAVASVTQIDAVNATCPYSSLDWVTTSSGLSFQVYCDRDVSGEDYTPLNWLHPQHTDTLDECMELCAEAHPLCEAVSWNADMALGWSNCYVKSSAIDTNLTTPTYTTHSAFASFGTINTTCVDDSLYTATNDTSFRIGCDQKIANETICTVHTASLDSCIDHCIDYNGISTCVAVAFQDKLTDGYENCYLKYSSGPVVDNTYGYSVAVVTNSSSSSSSSSSNSTSTNTYSTSSSTGTSKGVIAGAVVGAVLGAALLFAAIAYLLCRRRRTAAARRSIPDAAVPMQGAFTDDSHDSSIVVDKPLLLLPELGNAGAVHEMTGNREQPHELSPTGYHELEAWDPDLPSQHMIKHDVYR